MPDTGMHRYPPPVLPAGFAWPGKGATRGYCRSCGAPIWWAVGAKSGRWSPMNSPDPLEPERPVVSHFATCPQAASHRKHEESTSG